MKKTLLLFVVLFFGISGYSQSDIPKDISNEFGYAFIDNYKYGNGNTRVFVMNNLQRKGYNQIDIDVIVESIISNKKNREIVLQVFADFFSNREYLYANLRSLGISAASSKYLTDYILNKKNVIKESKSNVIKESNSNILDNIIQKDNTLVTNNVFFQGEKKYCEESRTWYYLVKIKDNLITLESYPDYNNDYHKNKAKPNEITKGKIVGKRIKLFPNSSEDEYNVDRFKIENGKLYEVNYEGDYNIYSECFD